MAKRTPEVLNYIEQVQEERKKALILLLDTIKSNLPTGFEETIAYGMITYAVPHSSYPAGYHCDPKIPLPFISVANQKNFMAVYHMGLYSDEQLYNWFQEAYKQAVPTKLDMGKSCIRFKKPETIPFELIGELATKMSPDAWIKLYEGNLKKSKK